MRFRSYLSEWFIATISYGIGGVVSTALSLCALPIVFWIFGARPLALFPLDAVIKLSLLGGVCGGIAGTGAYLTTIMERKKHRIQEPKRYQRQWRQWRPRWWSGSRRAQAAFWLVWFVAVLVLIVFLLYLGYSFFNNKPVSLPELSDIKRVAPAILVLVIIAGIAIWRGDK
jgi:hypothetical protein